MTRPLPILRVAALAYEDLWRLTHALRTLVLYALLIVLAVKVLENLVPLRAWNGPVLGQFLGIVIGAVQSFCLTPIMIAAHRYIVLDEVTPGYAVDPSEPSFIAFFSWLVALSLFSAVVFSVPDLLTAFGFSARSAVGPALMVAVVLAVLSLRLAILFPAIATGARGATAANALADSKGHVLSIFLIFLLTLLPMMALAVVVTLLIGRGEMVPGTAAAMAGLVLGGIIQTTILFLCVAIASRIFQGIGSRLLRQG